MTLSRSSLLALGLTGAIAIGGGTSVALANTDAAPAPVRSAGLSEIEQARATAAVNLLDGAFNDHKPSSAAKRYIDAKTYIQHNPDAPDGRAAFIGFVEGYVKQFPTASLKIKRVIAQGNLVVVHGLAKTSPSDRGTVEVDIFRFDKRNKIVEHWDALQPVRETTASGNPQV